MCVGGLLGRVFGLSCCWVSGITFVVPGGMPSRVDCLLGGWFLVGVRVV